MVSRLKCNTVEDLVWCHEVEASSRRVVVASCEVSNLGFCDCCKIRLSRQWSSQSTDGIFDAAFLPGGVGVAEECLSGYVGQQLMVAGELGAVVECYGSPEVGWQLPHAARDFIGNMGCCFIFQRDHSNCSADAFVDYQNVLSIYGERHEIGLPVTRFQAIICDVGALVNTASLLDELHGSDASTEKSNAALRHARSY